eukprot:Gb_13021 [translate_table: standard]
MEKQGEGASNILDDGDPRAIKNMKYPEGNSEMKTESGKTTNKDLEAENQMATEKTLKGKKGSMAPISTIGQEDSERQQNLYTKVKGERIRLAKKLKKERSNEGLDTQTAEEPSLKEVAPVAETILTNPEIFESSVSQESQERGCKSLKESNSREVNRTKNDGRHEDVKSQSGKTQQPHDAIGPLKEVAEFAERPEIIRENVYIGADAAENRISQSNSGEFSQKENNHLRPLDEKAAYGHVENFLDEDAALKLTNEAVSDDTNLQVIPKALSRAIAQEKGNLQQRCRETSVGVLLPQKQSEEAKTDVEKAHESKEKVVGQVGQVAEQVVQIGQKVMDQVAESLTDPVVEHVGQVAEHVSAVAEQVATQVVEQMATTAGQVTDKVSSKLGDLLAVVEEESEDEFEAYKTSDLPEFKGMVGIQNFAILQEDQGVMTAIYDFYTYMLKSSLPEFALAMFAAPILLSMIFTILYLPEFQGLALEETARQFFEFAGENKEARATGLQLSWMTLFQVFMFSVSLSTGLQPELAPLSPYTLVVANVNALIAQLIFVFMSGAVFARLSQPSQPVRFSTVALVYPTMSNRRQRPEGRHKVLMARYVLAGPQPCELVDVKVDLTYKYNTVTRAGTFFRATQSLKLVRTEIGYLNHGMLVRHVIDEVSPLYRRSPEMLKKEDAVFVLSVVGLERSSMQSVFHVQHYCVYDGDVIWDAEFEDMILINKKNKLIMDHSKLSKWKPARKT